MRWARPRSDSVLHISGGEPFLLPHLEEILEAGSEAGFGRIVVNTNGNRVTPARIERLARIGATLDLEISIDGPRWLHEEVRGKGTHRTVSEVTDRLLAAGINTAVFVTVTRELVPELPDWLQEIHQRWPGLEFIGLMPVGDPGRGQRLARPLRADELNELAKITVEAMLRGIKAMVIGNPAATLPLRRAGWHRNQCYRCTGGDTRLCVLADGTVTPCHPVPTPIGHVDRQSVEEVLAGDLARQMAAHDFDGCRECRFHMDCGGCRAYVLADGRPFTGRDPLCERLCDGGAPPPKAGG
jgi:radical SAM protein with 4Fe4S-binding SPASM domain